MLLVMSVALLARISVSASCQEAVFGYVQGKGTPAPELLTKLFECTGRVLSDVPVSGDRSALQAPGMDPAARPAGNRRIFVPGGIWWIGSSPYMTALASFVWRVDGHSGSPPSLEPAELEEIKPFWVDSKPVTIRRYTGSGPDEPVKGVSFGAARRFCRAKGGDLPTARQWYVFARALAYYKAWPWGEAIPLSCQGKPSRRCLDIVSRRDVSSLGVWWSGTYPQWVIDDGRPVIKGGLDSGWFWGLVGARRSPGQVDGSLVVFRCVYPVK